MVAVAVARQYTSTRALVSCCLRLRCINFVARTSTTQRLESQSNSTRALYKLKHTDFRYPSHTTSPTARAVREI